MHRTLASPRTAIWGGAAGLIFVVLLGSVIHLLGNGPLPVDSWWLVLMRSVRSSAGLVVAEAMAVAGGTTWMIIVGVLIVVTLVLKQQFRSSMIVVASMVISEALTTLMKLGFARERPIESLSDTGPMSFPSGHTTLAATVAVALALLVGRGLMWGTAAAWTVAMAWSRTYLAAHWLTDTLAGAILGASISLLIWAALREREANTTRAHHLHDEHRHVPRGPIRIHLSRGK
ncbi:phosphatase PAP2 family protein [Microbacterium sp. 1P06AB]|uniref:phosphatase PAP2 family protein n=1 Tax=Microbacterium sp. 1P06AB TaxID=3132289 RepID=UPI0039A4172B